MTWSYDVADLATSKKDQVRILIGDTNVKDPQLQDEEINLFISFRSSVYGAAAMGCLAIAAMYSRQVDTVQGELRTLYSTRARAYTLKAQNYETESTKRGGALPYAGGISVQDKQRQETNTDRVKPQYNIGMEDNFLPVGPVGNETEDYNPSSGNP